MMAEMNRGAEQGRQGLEIDTQGRGYVKSQGRLEGEAAAQQAAQMDAESRRINAVAAYKRAENDFQMASVRAQTAKTASGRAEAEQAMKVAKEQLMVPLEDSAKRLDRLQGVGKATPSDWKAVQQEVEGYMPDAGDLNQIKADIASKTWTPRLQQFMQQRANVQVLKYVAATGELPTNGLVDMGSPAMQRFTYEANRSKQMNDPSVPGPGQLLSFMDYSGLIQFHNQEAAMTILAGLPTEPQKRLFGAEAGQQQGEGDPNAATPVGEPDTRTQSPGREGGGYFERREGGSPGGLPNFSGDPLTKDAADQWAEEPVPVLGPNPTPEEEAQRKRSTSSIRNPGAVRPGHFMGR
jgi:hypothetical protein